MHPYKQFPPRQFWQQAVSGTPWAEVLAHEPGKFSITASDVVASAGSCFAQRISRLIIDSGLDYRYFETPHPLVPAAEAATLGYKLFSCRYGNIYTTRQLLQLVKEALGITPPIQAVSATKAGHFVDLMRPNINSTGFESVEEAVADRAWHLQCVARMLAQCNVFIFTLGLTETWMDSETGVVYGSHPSVITHLPSPRPMKAHNLDYLECYNDLVEVFNLMRGINPGVRFILTVSPVALAATHQPHNVLVSTAYSKAVLRAVAGKFAQVLPCVDYFPSFEVFNLAQSFGQFLSEDLRDVSQRGVQVAMGNFKQMFLQGASAPVAAVAVPAAKPAAQPAPVAPPSVPSPMSAPPVPAANAADVECDEVLNAFFDKATA
jgi:hypothetical protein